MIGKGCYNESTFDNRVIRLLRCIETFALVLDIFIKTIISYMDHYKHTLHVRKKILQSKHSITNSKQRWNLSKFEIAVLYTNFNRTY